MLKAKQRGHEPGAALLHQLRAFFVEHCAVLDGVYTGANGSLDAFGTFGVSHNFFPGAMSNLDGLSHLFLAQFLHCVIADRIHHAAAGHQLDPVGAKFNVAAYGYADLIDRISYIRGAW